MSVVIEYIETKLVDLPMTQPHIRGWRAGLRADGYRFGRTTSDPMIRKPIFR